MSGEGEGVPSLNQALCFPHVVSTNPHNLVG